MKFSSETREGIEVITVNLARATYNYAQEIKEILENHIAENKTKIVVCLASCKYMDSTFLGALVSSSKKLNDIGGSIKIADLRSETLVLFEITGMTRIFEIYKNIDEAIASYTNLVD